MALGMTTPLRSLSQTLFHDFDFLVRQIIQLIHQLTNLPVGGLDLALEDGLGLGRFGLRELLVKVQHPLDQGHHSVVAGFIGGIGEVDGADENYIEMDLLELSNTSPVRNEPVTVVKGYEG